MPFSPWYVILIDQCFDLSYHIWGLRTQNFRGNQFSQFTPNINNIFFRILNHFIQNHHTTTRYEQFVKNIQNALGYTDFSCLPLKWHKNASWYNRGGRRKKIYKGGDKLSKIMPHPSPPPPWPLGLTPQPTKPSHFKDRISFVFLLNHHLLANSVQFMPF